MFLGALYGLLLSLLSGCSDPGPEPVTADVGKRISLMALSPTEIRIPSDSRGGVAPPEKLPISTTWQYMGVTPKGMHKWQTPVPIRPRGLFFHEPEPGISLEARDQTPIRWQRVGKAAYPYWWHNRRFIFLFTPEKGTPPSAGDYVFSYPKATERERAMNFGMQEAGTQKADFVQAKVHHDWNTRHGLMLPAPGRISWELTIPPAAELVMAPGLSRPELLDGPESDGAELVVKIEQGDAVVEVERRPLAPGVYEQVSVDLSAWAGQSVVLALESDALGTPNFDYVFVGNPVVASKMQNPRRVVMVFIDTLRADHLGVYGYERDTSVKLDRWAEEAAVFENARSVAPWTLPSGRTIVTGRHPEFYGSTATVQKVLGDDGFLSAMIAGNVYLSTNFEMARDWGWHKVGMWPRASEITDDALAFLEATEGHDAILQVHYMDPHLPYLEPKAYRKLYAGQSAGGLGEEFHLPDVRKAERTKPGDKATRQYVIDRYDNNIRYATDEVARLLAHLDDNDVVLVYADHGEEFWEHGGFEHGHQLHDELLHVPLLLDAPGVDGVRISEPASLLDITPTILDALGVDDPEEEREGLSLLPAARGEDPSVLGARDLSFGRPLYGVERWGVLTRDNHKWMTHDGRQQAYDLNADPGELTDLLRGQPNAKAERYHEALGRGLDTEAGVAYRLFGSFAPKGATDKDLDVEIFVPGGVKHAWREHDPVGRVFAHAPKLSTPDEQGNQIISMTWLQEPNGQATIWFIPNLPFEDVTHNLEILACYGSEAVSMPIPANRPATIDGNLSWLVTRPAGRRTLRFGFGVAPVSRPDWVGVVGTDDEMSAELSAIGYQEDEMGGSDGGSEPSGSDVVAPEAPVEGRLQCPKP